MTNQTHEMELAIAGASMAGHLLTEFKYLPNGSDIAKCTKCGRGVMIHEKEISGQAISTVCPKSL